jgi:hypothetical protein
MNGMFHRKSKKYQTCPKQILKNYFSSFLDGARKEAKEPLAKFNARDESRSLLPTCPRDHFAVAGRPVDGALRHQKSRHSSLSHSLNPPKFRSPALFLSLNATVEAYYVLSKIIRSFETL